MAELRSNGPAQRGACVRVFMMGYSSKLVLLLLLHLLLLLLLLPKLPVSRRQPETAATAFHIVIHLLPSTGAGVRAHGAGGPKQFMVYD